MIKMDYIELDKMESSKEMGEIITKLHLKNPNITLRYKGINVLLARGYVAAFDGNKTILLNKNLIKYPQLLQSTLEHEVEHFIDVQKEKTKFDAVKNMVKTDVKHIFNRSLQWGAFGFQLKHPESFFPVMWFKEGKKTITVIVINQLVMMAFMLFFFLALAFFMGFIFSQ